MSDRYFTDEEIDSMAAAVHEHKYFETLESRGTDSFGRRIREFQCIECGKIRQFSPAEKAK